MKGLWGKTKLQITDPNWGYSVWMYRATGSHVLTHFRDDLRFWRDSWLLGSAFV